MESVVETVARGGKEVGVVDDKDESGEASGGGIEPSVGRGFGEKDVSGDDGFSNSGEESRAETGSFHSTCSEDRHDLDYLARRYSC